MAVEMDGNFTEFGNVVALITGFKGVYSLNEESDAAKVKRASILGGTVASVSIGEAIIWDFGNSGPTETAFLAGAGATFVKVEGIKSSEGT